MLAILKLIPLRDWLWLGLVVSFVGAWWYHGHQKYEEGYAAAESVWQEKQKAADAKALAASVARQLLLNQSAQALQADAAKREAAADAKVKAVQAQLARAKPQTPRPAVCAYSAEQLRAINTALGYTASAGGNVRPDGLSEGVRRAGTDGDESRRRFGLAERDDWLAGPMRFPAQGLRPVL